MKSRSNVPYLLKAFVTFVVNNFLFMTEKLYSSKLLK